MNLENLKNLSNEDREKVEMILAELKERKARYPILNFKPLPYQQEFLEAIKAKNEDWTPKFKFIVFFWWNWSWKTAFSAYVTMLIALWEECKKYWLPYVRSAPLIKIFTTTWDNIRDNLDRKYLLWTWSWSDIIKFPWYMNRDDKWEIVSSVRWDKEILKEIKLKNWTVITFWTYDQGQFRIQWWEPDFTWMDELPTRYDDLIEIWRWTRNMTGQLIMSATPTNYNKKIHDFIFSDEFKWKVFIRQVDSFLNTYADHSWMAWLSEEDKAIRRFWSFSPPQGLVYHAFSDDNIIPFVDPKKLWSKVTFYWSVDFWFRHPTAFLLIAVDEDQHVYIFDMFYESRVTMRELAKWIRKKELEYQIKLKKIYADSASAQERHELQEEGIKTIPVNKRAKVNGQSFRAWGAWKVNQMLNLWNIVIADTCVNLIDELRTHHFKDNWEVHKEWDDAVDALRYFVTEYTAPSKLKDSKRELRRAKKKIYDENRKLKHFR